MFKKALMLFILSSTFLIHQSSQKTPIIDEAVKTIDKLCLTNDDCDDKFFNHFCCDQQLINQCCNGFQYVMVNESLDKDRFNIVIFYAIKVSVFIFLVIMCILAIFKVLDRICDCFCSKLNQVKTTRIYANIDRSPILN